MKANGWRGGVGWEQDGTTTAAWPCGGEGRGGEGGPSHVDTIRYDCSARGGSLAEG